MCLIFHKNEEEDDFIKGMMYMKPTINESRKKK
jgi:hypothetical protein